MATRLKHAPLVYTLGMVQFPKIPGVERFTDNFLDKIRNEYPLLDEVKAPVYTTDFSPQGIQVGQQESRLAQFLSIDKKWGFILTEQGLYLHSIDYQDFNNFVGRFQNGIEALLNLQDIGIQWIRSVGIRYVNLITPKSKHELNEYIHPWVLPNEPTDSQLSIIQSAYVARYKTKIGELRLQSLRNPQFTLPPELQSPLILKNEWIKERPQSDFALIDIDHSISFEQPVKIDKKKVIKDLTNLRAISSSVFKSLGTDFALKEWK
jgi:uncharacterized protein (TIGR04255 family)